MLSPVALGGDAKADSVTDDLWAEDPDAGNRAYNLRHLNSPKRRALIRNEEDLVRAFQEIRARGDSFRIQSSGHCFAGFSQSEETLIDLREFNTVDVNLVEQTVTTGAGATIRSINKATAQHDLALPAGYCDTVAIGGHATGGGIGVLSRRFGLTSDNLLSANLVGASGKNCSS